MLKTHKDLLKIAAYFLIIPLVVWVFSLGKTVDIQREYKSNQRELNSIKIDNLPKHSIKQKPKEKNSLLDFVSNNKNIEIVKYNRCLLSKSPDYSLIADELILRADFFNLLKLSNSIEKSWDIRSLSFYTEMNYKEKKEYLNTRIIIINTSK